MESDNLSTHQPRVGNSISSVLTKGKLPEGLSSEPPVSSYTCLYADKDGDEYTTQMDARTVEEVAAKLRDAGMEPVAISRDDDDFEEIHGDSLNELAEIREIQAPTRGVFDLIDGLFNIAFKATLLAIIIKLCFFTNFSVAFNK